METMTILEQPATLHWDYDEEADVLYLSVGEPARPSASTSAKGWSSASMKPHKASSA